MLHDSGIFWVSSFMFLYFSALVLTEDKQQVQSDLPFNVLLQPSGDTKDQKGRVSTGTKFALEEWLNRNS